MVQQPVHHAVKREIASPDGPNPARLVHLFHGLPFPVPMSMLLLRSISPQGTVYFKVPGMLDER
jgi:hypothetical protein